MRIEVKNYIDSNKLLKKLGLGSDNSVQRYMCSEVARFCDPYVPMQQGILKNTTSMASDGSELIYTAPYAHYQYYGEVMAGRAPKHYTGDSLTYHGAMRGKEWDKRMMADKSKDLERSIELFIKRRGG